MTKSQVIFKHNPLKSKKPNYILYDPIESQKAKLHFSMNPLESVKSQVIFKYDPLKSKKPNCIIVLPNRKRKLYFSMTH
jgi:hypothetical protein